MTGDSSRRHGGGAGDLHGLTRDPIDECFSLDRHHEFRCARNRRLIGFPSAAVMIQALKLTTPEHDAFYRQEPGSN
jgi:hypothetical protein